MSELRRRKIAAPGKSVIERMIAAALLQAVRHAADFLTRGLSDTQRAGLDALLTIHEGTTVSNLSWARQGPGALGHRSLDRLIEQLTYLRAVGLPTSMTDPVHADRVRQLAREGARLTAQHLVALSVARRRATLVATVLDTIPRLTDEAIGVCDRLFGRLFRRAERRASESLQRDARTINDKIRLFTKIGDALIEAKASGGDAFAAVGNVIPWEKFAETIAEAKGLVRSEGPDYLALAERNHSVLRRIGPPFLAAFEFEGVAATGSILKAISSLREFYAGNRRTLPKDLPTGFVKRAWREAVKEAHRLVKRFEWHYTPKHGSWLDMAESELAVLTSQCLDRRIPDKPTLEKEVAAWGAHRNKHHAKADWQFTTDDACVKLKRLYPQL